MSDAAAAQRGALVSAHRRAGVFEMHLREAIELNRERSPRYAALSGGESRVISRRLVAAERLLLPFARWCDRRAAPYHRAGIPLLETLFMPMASAPPFAATRLPGIGARPTPTPRAAEMRRRVSAAYRSGGFESAADALAAELAALSVAPDGNALVRHLLESARRLAVLASAHATMARERGMPSPEPLLSILLRAHLWGLGPAGALDRRARPIQQRGIPILVQDLPPIPAE